MGLSCGEVLLSAEEERMGGVDPVMLERFRFLCDRASENGLSLIVGLLTGWMSGRLFVPPAFEERNILGDPEAVKWEVRFVRRFVREFRDHPAIGAWDLGNECNCMSRVSGESEAWEWMNTISSAIRLEDPSRPVVSGMHSISTDAWADWNMYDQGELLDVLTTHPYPLFTPECNREPFYTLRNELHSSCVDAVTAISKLRSIRLRMFSASVMLDIGSAFFLMFSILKKFGIDPVAKTK